MGNEVSARQQAKKAEEIRSIVSDVSTESEADDVVDPRVTDRMLQRVILFSGTPVLLGLLLFPFFWYLKVNSLSTVCVNDTASCSRYAIKTIVCRSYKNWSFLWEQCL